MPKNEWNYIYEHSTAMFCFLLREEQEARHCWPKEAPYPRPSLVIWAKSALFMYVIKKSFAVEGPSKCRLIVCFLSSHPELFYPDICLSSLATYLSHIIAKVSWYFAKEIMVDRPTQLFIALGKTTQLTIVKSLNINHRWHLEWYFSIHWLLIESNDEISFLDFS